MLVLLSLALRLLLDLAQRFAEDGSTMEQFGLPTPQGVDTEVERERLRWNCDEEKAKFTHLCSASPNTDEMAALFVVIKKAIDTAATLFVYIQGECAYYCLPRYAISFVPSRCVVARSGEAGTGKTTFAQKLCAYVRGQDKVALGCAATALASQVYINDYFVTAHELFKIPVVDDWDDLDTTNEILSKIKWGDERHTLLQKHNIDHLGRIHVQSRPLSTCGFKDYRLF